MQWDRGVTKVLGHCSRFELLSNAQYKVGASKVSACSYPGGSDCPQASALTGVAPSKDDACSACVAAANQTATWTNYCQCFVSNSNKSAEGAGMLVQAREVVVLGIACSASIGL